VNGGAGNGNVQIGSGGVAQSGSPVKESSFLNRETSVDELEESEKDELKAQESVSPPGQSGGIPIRR
jgi:hypothetical protein